MLIAGGPQAGQHGDSRAVERMEGWTQSFARTRWRPLPRHKYCRANRREVQDCFFAATAAKMPVPMAKPETPLVRLLNAPDLPAIVPRLQPEVLHRVIHTYGLEDCTELVALATPAQLARVLDLDLWRAGPPGADERFDADRVGVWLAGLLDAGPEVAADKLAGLDLNLVVAGFARHIVVSDHAAVAAYTMLDGTRVPGIPPRGKLVSEIGGYTVESRRASAWEAIGELLSYLAAEHGALFHRIMRGCVRLSNGA